MLQVLREDGQPSEKGWPYLPALPKNLKTWVPPKKLGTIFRRDGEVKTSSVDEVISLLNANRPAVISMYLSSSFDVPNAEGIVIAAPGEAPDLARRHAIIAVAHGKAGVERVVLVRNSWGPNWGIGGYAWLTEGYLISRLRRVALLTEDVDVPTN